MDHIQKHGSEFIVYRYIMSISLSGKIFQVMLISAADKILQILQVQSWFCLQCARMYKYNIPCTITANKSHLISYPKEIKFCNDKLQGTNSKLGRNHYQCGPWLFSHSEAFKLLHELDKICFNHMYIYMYSLL